MRIEFRSITLEEGTLGAYQQTRFIEVADKSSAGKRQSVSMRCYVRATARSAGSSLSADDSGSLDLKIDRIGCHDRSVLSSLLKQPHLQLQTDYFS